MPLLYTHNSDLNPSLLFIFHWLGQSLMAIPACKGAGTCTYPLLGKKEGLGIGRPQAVSLIMMLHLLAKGTKST